MINPEQANLDSEQEKEDIRRPEYIKARFLEQLSDVPENERRVIEEALSVAEIAHADQKRDEGDAYIVHPLRVALDVIQRLGRKDVKSIAIALLHDVVEDSDIMPEELRGKFGDEIADAVVSLSKRKDLSKIEAFNEYYERVKKLSPELAEIKLLDRLDNLLFLHFSPKSGKQESYIRKTEQHYLPLAERVNQTLFEEMQKRINTLKSRRFS